MSNNHDHLDHSFLALAIQYLHTTESILEETIKSGNIHFYSGDKLKEGEYSEVTKWSDFNVMIPSLLLLLHGIELSLKGLLLLHPETNKDNFDKDHNIENLFSSFKEKYKKEKKIISLFKKYVHGNSKETPKVLKLLISNNPEINNTKNLYEALRYPSNKDLKTKYNYSPIKYKEEEGLSFAQELKRDIGNIRIEMVRIYRNST